MGQCMSCNSSSLDANRQLKKARDIGERLSAREQKKNFISDTYMHQLIKDSNKQSLLEQYQSTQQSPRRGQSHLLYNKKQHYCNNAIMESPSMTTPTALQQQQQQQQHEIPYHYPMQQQHEQLPLDSSFQPVPITTTKIIRRIRKGVAFYTSDKTQLDIESEEQQQQQQQQRQESKKEPKHEKSSSSSDLPQLSPSRPGIVHIYALRENLASPENVGKKSDTYPPNENGVPTQKVQQEQRPIPKLTKKQLEQQQQQQQQHDNMMISSFANEEESLEDISISNNEQNDTDQLQDPISNPRTRTCQITTTASSSTLSTPLTPTRLTSPLQHHQGTLSPPPSPLMTNTNTTTTTTNATNMGGGVDMFSPQAMASLPNPPPRPIVDWVCVSSKYQIYICDTDLRMDQCHEIVYQTEIACRGHYHSYTYAKQTLGCREYPALAMPCLEPVHKVCHAIITRLVANAPTSQEAKVVVEPSIINNNKENQKEEEEEEEESPNDNSTTNTPPPSPPSPKNMVLVLDDREPHVVKYDVTKKERQKLDMHTDKSEWSFLIALSDGCGWDYDGGGTYFEGLGATVHLQRGQCLIFPGKLRHCGQKITKGLRFLLVGFLVDKTQSQSNLALAAATASGSTIPTATATTTTALKSSPSSPSPLVTTNDAVTSTTSLHPQEVKTRIEPSATTTMDTITTATSLAKEEEENVVNGSCCGI